MAVVVAAIASSACGRDAARVPMNVPAPSVAAAAPTLSRAAMDAEMRDARRALDESVERQRTSEAELESGLRAGGSCAFYWNPDERPFDDRRHGRVR